MQEGKYFPYQSCAKSDGADCWYLKDKEKYNILCKKYVIEIKHYLNGIEDVIKYKAEIQANIDKHLDMFLNQNLDDDASRIDVFWYIIIDEFAGEYDLDVYHYQHGPECCSYKFMECWMCFNVLGFRSFDEVRHIMFGGLGDVVVSKINEKLTEKEMYGFEFVDGHNCWNEYLEKIDGRWVLNKEENEEEEKEKIKEYYLEKFEKYKYRLEKYKTGEK